MHWPRRCRNSPSLDRQYVRLFIWRLRAAIIAMGRGIAFPSVTRQQIEELPVPLPPLAEQDRIVAKVEELMALCDRVESAQTERESRRDRLAAASLHRLNNGADADEFREHARFHLHNLPRVTTRVEHIHQLRQTILNLAVRGKLTNVSPSVVEDETIALDAATDPRYPISYGVLKPGPKHSGGVPLIKSQHIRDWRVDENLPDLISPELDLEFKRTKIKGGEVLLNLVGASIGRCAVAPASLKGANVSRAVAVITLKQEVLPRYVLIILTAAFTEARVSEIATGSAQPVLNIGQIRKLRVWLPLLAEQRRIVTRVDELLGLCDRLEAQLTSTVTENRRLLEAVLQQARDGLLRTAQ